MDRHLPTETHAAAQRATAARYAQIALLHSSAGNAGYTQTQWTSLEPAVTWTDIESFTARPYSEIPEAADVAEAAEPLEPFLETLPWAGEMTLPHADVLPYRNTAENTAKEETLRLKQVVYDSIPANLVAGPPAADFTTPEIAQLTLRRQLLSLGYQSATVQDEHSQAQPALRQTKSWHDSALEYVDVEILK